MQELEEIVVAPELDEVIFARDSPTEWSSCSSIDSVAITVVEFSESLGPDPLLVIPTPTTHLDLDTVALSLMTSDPRQTGRPKLRLDSSLVGQGFMMLESEGVAMIYVNFTLKDVQARGHTRQFAVAILSPDCECLRLKYVELTGFLLSIIESVCTCNFAIYEAELSFCLEFYRTENLESNMLDTLNCGFSEAEELLELIKRRKSSFTKRQCNYADHMPFSVENLTKERSLRQFSEICSCAFPEFVRQLRALPDLASGNVRDVVFSSDNGPAVLSPLRAVLPHVLFSLFTGRTVVVTGSATRKSGVTQVVRQLASIDESSRIHRAMIWNETDLTLPLLDQYHVIGQCTERNSDKLAGVNLVSLIDLNESRFLGLPYGGGFLSLLEAKRMRNCSDVCFRKCAAMLKAKYGLLAYILFHVVYKDQASYRAQARNLSRICGKLAVYGCDLIVCKKLLSGFRTDAIAMNGRHENEMLNCDVQIVSLKI